MVAAVIHPTHFILFSLKAPLKVYDVRAGYILKRTIRAIFYYDAR